MNEENSVIKTIRTMITSPLFLVVAISYSVYGLFEILAGIADTGSSMLENLMNLLNQGSYGMNYGMNYGMGYGMGYGLSDSIGAGAGYESMQSLINTYNNARIVLALLGAAPVIVIAVGTWLLFASAKGNKQNEISITGLTMIRIVVIVQLVWACLKTALLEIVCFIIMWYTKKSVVFLLMLLIGGIAAVGILYYLKLGRSIVTMKNTMISGSPDERISKYVEICSYILGGVSALSALVSLGKMSMYGFLSNAGIATANIAFAIYIMKYRKNMEWLIQNPNMIPPSLHPVNTQKKSVTSPYQAPQQQYQNAAQPPQYQGAPVTPPHQAAPPQPQYQGQSGETMVLQYNNETTVLSGQMLLVRMTRQKTGETFSISKPSFWIGKDAENVDYCITDNNAISRRHALFSILYDGCSVRDNHSTNRVFLNGQVLLPDVDTPLSDGDRVRLGDEEFIVNIG